ncbi:MAG: alpha/beta hydrolase, partial [Chloroflexota bacterium]|nr:alpha/beta hydrolase [Chloroflexota bacterium]
SINGDPSSIAVGGDSAGGNLATAICLMARDQNGPALAFQLLVYPVTMRDFKTVSYEENASGYSLTRDSMKWFWNHYLASDADASNPYAAPMQAKSLKGLPPALVITAQYDPLRDEGEDYAHRLQDEGVSTKCTRYDGMMHGFFANPSVFDKGKIAVDEASAAMKGAFGR